MTVVVGSSVVCVVFQEAFEGWSISPNVMVKYGRGWMVSCSDVDAKVQVFF